jgi:hypothetical protein
MAFKNDELNYEESFLKAIVHDATSGVYEYNGTDLSTPNEADYVLQAALVDLENFPPEKAIVKIEAGIVNSKIRLIKTLELLVDRCNLNGRN